MLLEAVAGIEGKRMLSTILYIGMNSGCTKGQLYDAASRNIRMPEMLRELESRGILRIDIGSDGHSEKLSLTSLGKKMFVLLKQCAELLISESFYVDQ